MSESPPPLSGKDRRSIVPRFRRLKSIGRAVGPLLALAIVVGCFGVADRLTNGDRGQFFTALNARTIAAPTATIVVAALGMTLIIIAGGIDLSAGTGLALCATVLASALMDGRLKPYNPLAAIALTLATGALCGFVNGVVVSSLRVVPFIVTLGTMRLYLGVANMLAKETTVRPDRATQVPGWLERLLSIRADALLFGFPWGVWVALALAAATGALLQYTVFGRHIFALGSNEMAARLCGISVRGMKIAVYTLAGFFFGIAGVFQFSRLTVGSPVSGVGMELKVIAAVVIGGASLNGGRGSILGTLAGAAVMGVIDNGCTLLGLSNPVQDVVLGIVIVTAVAVDQLRQRRLEI
jgi:ribose/xylose/arabinose/galactoside ABC-type transport system permease subunit